MSRILRAPGHYGYCRVHGQYECAACTRADARDRARENEFGVFEWRADGRYPRGTAIETYKTERGARGAIEKRYGDRNVVVRTLAIPREEIA